jgi:hypothetical protein
MVALTAAVIIVGILCLLDMLLSFGVIRRLREHSELLRTRQYADEPPVISLSAGQMPAEFAVTADDGAAVVTGPAGLRLAGFFSASCSVCPGRVAPFIEYVSANRINRDDVLVTMLTADGAAAPPYLSQLAEVALVTVPPDGDLIAKAFGVAGFPAFCLLDPDGAVVATGYDPAALPAPAMT